MNNRSNFNVMKRLIVLVRPLAGFMILAIIMGILGNLAAAFITIFGGYALAELLNIDTPFTLKLIFISVCLFALFRGILRYAEQACNHFIAFKLLALIRDKVFTALRRLCPAKLEGKEKGNLISVITSDIELLEVFYAHTISPILIAFVFSIIMCLFIAGFSGILGLVALLAYITVGVIIPLLTSRFCGDSGARLRTKAGSLSGYVLDSLRGLSEILQYAQGEDRISVMNEQTEALSEDEEKMKRTAGRNQAVTNSVILFFDILMLFASTILYQKGQLEFIGVLIPTLALMSSFGPVVALANLGSSLQNTFAAGNRVLDILDEAPVVEEIKGMKEISFTGATAENVTFAYDEENILDNVSVDIPLGSVVGIVGKSGSGKSTLLRLFMRFWKTQNGSVQLSGTDINHINTSNLRNMESFVTQDTHLFHDSIRNNLRIAKLDATDKEMEIACKRASVHDFIMSLPQGYDTSVGELGDTLSGGERQRLGLARAFLHDSDLLLLDEPTSNLDSLNEAVILKAIREEMENKTVVLVSHRQSTMRIADKIYSVEHGRMS
ncbi:MAG: thiol reductant ABC exporter subunit CydC [Wujia sp.]